VPHGNHEQDQNCRVYCGSGPGTNAHFVEGATTLGKIFAENGVSLGLWRGLERLDGRHRQIHTGSWRQRYRIIPDFLIARENALARVQELIVTPDMHERKRLMFERSDAFVALPGGIARWRNWSSN